MASHRLYQSDAQFDFVIDGIEVVGMVVFAIEDSLWIIVFVFRAPDVLTPLQHLHT